ncbi:hypothetical protein GCM10022236_14410 [Microlunatus ginsengisoli]|uniref:Uncharacterized protein n=2 Tax=Microlunatus ginsengisoli TaxID=363863 RepID=A0ABP6ZMM8_9ACTN
MAWQAGLMSEQPGGTDPDDERVEDRAELLPEERAAGSADPEAQAAAILAESDERVADPEGTGATSTQTISSRPEPA